MRGKIPTERDKVAGWIVPTSSRWAGDQEAHIDFLDCHMHLEVQHIQPTHCSQTERCGAKAKARSAITPISVEKDQPHLVFIVISIMSRRCHKRSRRRIMGHWKERRIPSSASSLVQRRTWGTPAPIIGAAIILVLRTMERSTRNIRTTMKTETIYS